MAWAKSYLPDKTEFDMQSGDFSKLEIRDSGHPSGLHYFFDTKANHLVTDFVLEKRPQVSTLCQITLIKKGDEYSPRLRLWKRDTSKRGKKAFEHVASADEITTIIKATVDTDSCYEQFWRLIDFVQAFKGVTMPDNSFRVINTDSAKLAEQLQGQDRETVLHAVQAFIGDSPLTQADINIMTNRKRQIDRFDLLLNDPTYFERERKELQKPDRKLPGIEAVWQNFFEQNSWIFGYGLSLVACERLDGDAKLEQITAGQNIFTGAGKRSDAVMRSKGFISSLVFCEIKTHTTDLVEGEAYRSGVYPASKELAGAVAQVQKTVAKALRLMNANIHQFYDDDGTPTDIQVSSIRAKQVVVIGNLTELSAAGRINPEKTSSFELFRNAIHDVEIITFDELFERARFIVEDV
ncbi:Shedu immune nuclease family protein [Nocardia sp. BMG111209]|uniref:Shedu immune nuclease family protein n=1 Tax=Nocardia sp. BMG111209 TaxID=1160137 RepID=UPI0009DC23E0|nr:Shedu immune nuclease family protein [Nocardia sp. BMG111209]